MSPSFEKETIEDNRRKVNGSIQCTDTVLYNTAEDKGKQYVLMRTSIYYIILYYILFYFISF
jgi:hypothetical protein